METEVKTETLQVYFRKQLKIKDKVFKIGVHEVPQDIVDHPHFAQYCKWGEITEPGHEKLSPKKETPHELRLKTKLEEDKKALSAKIAAESEAASKLPPSGDPMRDEKTKKRK